MKKVSYLLLSKRRETKRKKELFSRNPQENDSNGTLKMRGRRWCAQILIWDFLTWACKENKGEEERVLLSWLLRMRVAGNEGMGSERSAHEGEGHLSQMGCGPHWLQNLRWIKHRFVGLGWNRRRRQNRSPKNLVSKKYKFGIVLRFRNLGPGLMWNDRFTPFNQNLEFWVLTKTGWTQKLNNKIKPFKWGRNHD